MARSAKILAGAIAGIALALASPATAQEKAEKIPIEVVNGARVYYPSHLSSGEKCQKAKASVVSSARLRVGMITSTRLALPPTP